MVVLAQLMQQQTENNHKQPALTNNKTTILELTQQHDKTLGLQQPHRNITKSRLVPMDNNDTTKTSFSSLRSCSSHNSENVLVMPAAVCEPHQTKRHSKQPVGAVSANSALSS